MRKRTGAIGMAGVLAALVLALMIPAFVWADGNDTGAFAWHDSVTPEERTHPNHALVPSLEEWRHPNIVVPSLEEWRHPNPNRC